MSFEFLLLLSFLIFSVYFFVFHLSFLTFVITLFCVFFKEKKNNYLLKFVQKSSFEDIEKFWINEVESYAEKNVDLLMLGNKSDVDKKAVETQRAEVFN